MKIVIAILLTFVVGAGAFRVFRHESDLKPALVTPTMDVHNEISGDFSARLYRVVHSAVAATQPARPKLIALTFDDGPYPIFTPLLLDELRDLKVPATFFLIGRDAEQWPELARRIEEYGNEVGDHTYSHPDLDHETPDEVATEITRGRDVLWQLTHDPAVRALMRPPHGRYTEQTLRVAQSIGYNVVLWTDDSGDWRTMTPAQIEANMLRHASAPDIVLLHSGKLATIEALPAVIERFRSAGYEFVTAGELIRRVSPQALNHPLRRAV
jgi:peptidoglycan-N-acetylglucosamine deacetylase